MAGWPLARVDYNSLSRVVAAVEGHPTWSPLEQATGHTGRPGLVTSLKYVNVMSESSLTKGFKAREGEVDRYREV